MATKRPESNNNWTDKSDRMQGNGNKTTRKRPTNDKKMPDKRQ